MRALPGLLLAWMVAGPLPSTGQSLDVPLGPEPGPTARAGAWVSYAAEPQVILAGRMQQLTLRFQVAAGYHVNSHTPRSQFLIPTELRLQPADGVKPGAAAYPAGAPYSFASAPQEKLDVYAGRFSITLPVQASAGEHVLHGTLRYQACDRASCYPPQQLAVQVPFQARN
ncbi:MAG: disulfide bond formation protein DsbC [Acidobacteriota bacterium]|nr:disulfide bond formation protein DsbC [Acidobacteriota bacterium]